MKANWQLINNTQNHFMYVGTCNSTAEKKWEILQFQPCTLYSLRNEKYLEINEKYFLNCTILIHDLTYIYCLFVELQLSLIV